jgi:hypothetical protein
MLTKSYQQLRKLHDDLKHQFSKAGMIALPEPLKRVCATLQHVVGEFLPAAVVTGHLLIGSFLIVCFV